MSCSQTNSRVKVKECNFFVKDNSSSNDVEYKIFIHPITTPTDELEGVSKLSNKEILEIIEVLLSFEGDDRACCVPVTTYNMSVSKIYFGPDESYSLQLEALFLINQLYFEYQFEYGSIPVLIKGNKKAHRSAKLVKEAYFYYKKWFEKVEKIGLEKARSSNIKPLDDSDISWY